MPQARPFSPHPVAPPVPTTTMATPAVLVAIEWTQSEPTPVEPPATSEDLDAPLLQAETAIVPAHEASISADSAREPELASENVEIAGEAFNVSIVSPEADASDFAVDSVVFDDFVAASTSDTSEHLDPSIEAEPVAELAIESPPVEEQVSEAAPVAVEPIESSPVAEEAIDTTHDYPTPPLGIAAIEAAFEAAAAVASPLPAPSEVMVVDDANESPWMAVSEVAEPAPSMETDEPRVMVETDAPITAADELQVDASEAPVAAHEEPRHESVDAFDELAMEPVNAAPASVEEVDAIAALFGEPEVESVVEPVAEEEPKFVAAVEDVSAAEPEELMLDDVLNDFVVRESERMRKPEPILPFEGDAEAEAELQAIGGPQAAAGVLEAIARRIRGGEIVVAPPATQSGDAAVLAAVLTALLTKRD
jgi:hypothetical protein